MKLFRALILLALVCVLPLLNGCGIKPDFVDPPQGAEQDQFPRTYPDPETDGQF